MFVSFMALRDWDIKYEGAAHEGGKGPSIWDTYTHSHPGLHLFSLFLSYFFHHFFLHLLILSSNVSLVISLCQK